MARPTFAPTGQERQFEHHELFFSTTDTKGIILGCNDVFVRIAGHPREELIGSAHNIIRHPDMPQAVFKLLWDYLDAGRPFAGYVKNLAADGGYYWVVALVVPVEQGFLSVRFKPSTPMLAVVEGIYKQLLAIEKAAATEPGGWRRGMQLATDFLVGALKSKTFTDYDDFMQTMLATELASHRALLDRRRQGGRTAGDRDAELAVMLEECGGVDDELGGLFAKMGMFLTATKALDAKAMFLRELAANMHLVSLNALIGSCAEGAGGEGFSVVTQDLASLSKESTGTIEVMTRNLLTLTLSLRETAFSINAAKLQVEMTMFFLKELAASGEDWQHSVIGMLTRSDIAALRDSFRASVLRIAGAVDRAIEPIPKLLQMESELASDLRRISCVRLVGKIHSTGLTGEAHFHEMLDRILEQLARATTELEELTDGVTSLRVQMPELHAAATRVQGRSCGCRHLLDVAA